jgi:hypothetical protein
VGEQKLRPVFNQIQSAQPLFIGGLAFLQFVENLSVELPIMMVWVDDWVV